MLGYIYWVALASMVVCLAWTPTCSRPAAHSFRFNLTHQACCNSVPASGRMSGSLTSAHCTNSLHAADRFGGNLMASLYIIRAAVCASSSTSKGGLRARHHASWAEHSPLITVLMSACCCKYRMLHYCAMHSTFSGEGGPCQPMRAFHTQVHMQERLLPRRPLAVRRV